MAGIEIRSLPDYLAQIFTHKSNEFYNDAADLKIMYRGQADSSWSLLPSVFRSADDFQNERVFIREYERQMPEMCSGKDGLSILIDAQHFGIPTRLLDVTLNPLVALYFACEDIPSINEGREPDGVVIQFEPSAVFQQDDITALAYAEYVRHYKTGAHLSDGFKSALITSIKQSGCRFSNDAASAVENILTDNPGQLFISPTYSNARIIAQEGAFLLCATSYVKEEDSNIWDGYFQAPNLKNSGLDHVDVRYVVPHAKKKEILQQLDNVGIRESTLFPDVEHKAKAITAAIRKSNLFSRSV